MGAIEAAIAAGDAKELQLHAHTLKVTDEQKIEAAKYLYLLENKHVNINCIAYNRSLKKFFWDKKTLKRYLDEGNREIESVVDNMLT